MTSIAQRAKSAISNNRRYLLISIIFLVYTLGSFGIYYARTLEYNINNHILAGQMFGVPADLQTRGIKPLYDGPGQTGWDGQFYYYMSNDILALKDTPKHIDSPSYRYQRIGLSLYVASIAKILGMDWVSPATYFIIYLILVLAATWAGARLFARIGVHPAWILLWSLSVGTQITLFNALPDAAADAFLILALAAIFSKRYAMSAIPVSFAAWSREGYVLFPCFIFTVSFIKAVLQYDIKKTGWKSILIQQLKCPNYYLLAVPGVVAVAWYGYVVHHFGIAPSEQAHGILGYPLIDWWKYFYSGFQKNHKLVGTGWAAYAEAITLLFFVSFLVIAFWLALLCIIKYSKTDSNEILSISLATLSFAALYSCFGPTVISHYTGYFKAVGVFFIGLPLLATWAGLERSKRVLLIGLLIAAILFSTVYNMRIRILPDSANDKWTQMSKVTNTDRIECIGTYNAKVEVTGFTIVRKKFPWNLLKGKDQLVVDVDLKNTGRNSYISTRNFGSFYMSYHWVDANGKVVMDGRRSAISPALLPGEHREIKVVSTIPDAQQNLSLVLSPVQEGCAWFYMENRESSNTFKISLSYY